jgi:hypothetical protein
MFVSYLIALVVQLTAEQANAPQNPLHYTGARKRLVRNNKLSRAHDTTSTVNTLNTSRTGSVTCSAPPAWAAQSTLGVNDVASVITIDANTMNNWQLRCCLHWCGIFFLQSKYRLRKF